MLTSSIKRSIVNLQLISLRTLSSSTKNGQDQFKSHARSRQGQKDFINTEMKENPEFFKAFPHLQEPAYRALRPEAEANQYLDDIQTTELFEESELKGDSSQANFFESL
jgi:hypothetical protein